MRLLGATWHDKHVAHVARTHNQAEGKTQEVEVDVEGNVFHRYHYLPSL